MIVSERLLVVNAFHRSVTKSVMDEISRFEDLFIGTLFNSVVIAEQREREREKGREKEGEREREKKSENFNDRLQRDAHALVDVLPKRFIIENRCTFGSVEAEEITRAIRACAGASE